MLYFVLNLAFLLVLGLLGLMGTGGLPGGNKDANAAAENVAAKLAPFAGIIGVVALVWGIIALIDIVTSLGILLEFMPIYAIVGLVGVAVLIGLGLIGSSLSHAIRRAGLADSIAGHAQSARTLKQLLHALFLGRIGIRQELGFVSHDARGATKRLASNRQLIQYSRQLGVADLLLHVQTPGSFNHIELCSDLLDACLVCLCMRLVSFGDHFGNCYHGRNQRHHGRDLFGSSTNGHLVGRANVKLLDPEGGSHTLWLMPRTWHGVAISFDIIHEGKGTRDGIDSVQQVRQVRQRDGLSQWHSKQCVGCVVNSHGLLHLCL